MTVIGVVAAAVGGVDQLREGLVQPQSANSEAKLAPGIGDNQALTVLSEALGITLMVIERIR